MLPSPPPWFQWLCSTVNFLLKIGNSGLSLSVVYYPSFQVPGSFTIVGQAWFLKQNKMSCFVQTCDQTITGIQISIHKRKTNAETTVFPHIVSEETILFEFGNPKVTVHKAKSHST